MVLEENSFLMPPKSQVITVFHPAMLFLPLYPKSWIQLLLYPWDSGKDKFYIHHSRFVFWVFLGGSGWVFCCCCFLLLSLGSFFFFLFFHINNILESCLKKKCRPWNMYAYIYMFINVCTHPYERKYDLHSPFTVIQFLSIIVWSSVLHDSALWVWIAKQEHHRYLLNSIHAFPLNCSNLGSASRWLTPKIRLALHLLHVCLNPPFIGRWKDRGWNS